MRGGVDIGSPVIGVWLRHLIGGPMAGLGIEPKHLPAVQHACPHLAVFVRHGFVEIGVGMRGNRRHVFINSGGLGIELDQRAIRSAPPGISEGIKAAAFRGHHVSAAVQIQHFPGFNVQHLDGIAPIRRPAASPIPAVVGNGVVVAAVGLKRPLLQDLAGIRIHLGNPVRAGIPHIALRVQREISETGRVDGSLALDKDLLHFSGLWVQPVELMRPVFRNPGDAVLVDDGVVRSRHGAGVRGIVYSVTMPVFGSSLPT